MFPLIGYWGCRFHWGQELSIVDSGYSKDSVLVKLSVLFEFWKLSSPTLLGEEILQELIGDYNKSCWSFLTIINHSLLVLKVYICV